MGTIEEIIVASFGDIQIKSPEAKILDILCKYADKDPTSVKGISVILKHDGGTTVIEFDEF